MVRPTMAVLLKPIVSLAIAALLLGACTMARPGPTPTPIPISSPTPSATPADSKAANLRIQVDLLLGEHVMVVAKQAVAASNHTDDYTGYLTLLTANANSLAEIIRSGFGNGPAAQVEQAWTIQNGYLVDYTIGLATHNDDKSNGAMSGLTNGFVPQFAQVITSLIQLPAAQVTQLVTQQVTQMKAVIDEEVAQSYPKMYSDIRAAYADRLRLGDGLAIRMAQQFPDKFPGDPSSKAVDARVSLNYLLQEHSYLATMTTNAAASQRPSEQNGAAAALGANADALGKFFTEMLGAGAGTQIAQLWGARNSDLIAYATSGDAAARQGLTDKFVTGFYALAPVPVGVETAREQVNATIKVVDDQRAKAFKQVAGDDRAAASAMRAIADRIV
jgi:hypothetical protein